MKIEHLPVPGATLYYEVRGTGPVLLLICGGIYDAAGYADLADQMADRYTVVTYDRRGNSRSPLADPPTMQSIPEHADDAARLLTAVGVTPAEPAYVFGNSSGAEIGLELVVQHPELVRALVAHEPPLLDMLPEREHWLTVLDETEAAYAEGGVAAAGAHFGAAMGMRGGEDPDRIPGGGPAPPPMPQTLAMLARFERNTDFFFGYEVPPFGRYRPDLAALRTAAATVRIVPAAGAASEGEPPNRAALALATALALPPATFPGDHGGFGSHADSFATLLGTLLT